MICQAEVAGTSLVEDWKTIYHNLLRHLSYHQRETNTNKTSKTMANPRKQSPIPRIKGEKKREERISRIIVESESDARFICHLQRWKAPETMVRILLGGIYLNSNGEKTPQLTKYKMISVHCHSGFGSVGTIRFIDK